MVEAAGELILWSIEALAGILDFGTWFGTQPPRAGYRYRVRRPIDTTGYVLPPSSHVTAFATQLAAGTLIEILNEPAQERTDVDVRVEGALDGIIPKPHHSAAIAAGYVIVVPTVFLPSHCKRISKGQHEAPR